MLEILALIFLVKKNSFNAIQRGRKPLGFVLLTPLLWFLMEIYGAFLGALITSNWGLTYLFAVVFAILGGAASYYFARTCKVKMPFDSSEQANMVQVNGNKGFPVKAVATILVVLIMAAGLMLLLQDRGENLESLVTGRTIHYTKITLNLQRESGEPISDEEFKVIKRILKDRLEADRERNIKITLVDENTVKVVAESRYNNEDTLKNIGREGILTFQEVDEAHRDLQGDYLPTGKIILGDQDVTSARLQVNQVMKRKEILFELTEAGSAKFAEATERLIGQDIGIFLDDRLIFSANVAQTIKSKEVAVQNADEGLSQTIVDIVNGEKMPYDLIVID